MDYITFKSRYKVLRKLPHKTECIDLSTGDNVFISNDLFESDAIRTLGYLSADHVSATELKDVITRIPVGDIFKCSFYKKIKTTKKEISQLHADIQNNKIGVNELTAIVKGKGGEYREFVGYKTQLKSSNGSMPMVDVETPEQIIKSVNVNTLRTVEWDNVLYILK